MQHTVAVGANGQQVGLRINSSSSTSREPKTNTEFWRNKIETNVKRDRRVTKELRKAGWSVCRIWECQLKKPQRSLARIQKLLTKTKY